MSGPHTLLISFHLIRLLLMLCIGLCCCYILSNLLHYISLVLIYIRTDQLYYFHAVLGWYKWVSHRLVSSYSVSLGFSFVMRTSSRSDFITTAF
jgi:hypothetical protein